MCWNCWCWCEENPISNWCNCSIIGRNATSVTQEWNDIVVSSPFYEVVSSDSTVVVTKTTVADPNVITFDVSKPCCPDRLVAVSPGCTTWVTLKEWIQVDTSWPLTWTQNWCNSMNLWFDVSKLTAKDEKVKWKSSCPAVFWDQLLVAWEWLNISDVWCKWRIELTSSPFIKPMLQQYISSSLTFEYGHWQQADLPNNWWFPIYTDEYVDNWLWFINRNEYTIDPDPKPWSSSDWWGTVGWFIVPKDWFYRLWMWTNIWVNWWVESCRVTLAWNVWWDYRVLLNIWFSSPNWYSLADRQSTDTGNPEEWIIWNWCSATAVYSLSEWDVIYWLFWRMNNEVMAWPWTATSWPWRMWVFAWPFWFNPFGTGNSAPSNPEYSGTYWWVEWISDWIWDSRYYK